MTFTKKAAEVRTFSVNFNDRLVGTEVLSGTPTAVEVGTSVLTLAVERNDAIVPILGMDAGIDTAVRLTVTGGVAGSTYVVRVTTATSEGQTLIRKVRIVVN